MAEERRRGITQKPILRSAEPIKKPDGSYEIRGYLAAETKELRQGYIIQISGKNSFVESGTPTDELGRFGPIEVPAPQEPEVEYTIFAAGSTADPVKVILRGAEAKTPRRYPILPESMKASWNPFKLFWRGITGSRERRKK